jgi:polysaccharide export outer membrane protein
VLGAAAGARAQDATPREYVVGPNDLLLVTLWDQPDLSGKFRIDADGSFTFPLVGRVQAARLPIRDVERKLREALSNGFFKNPQVTVSIEEYGSQRFFVMGEVRQPGAYPLSGRMTLIEALARAGSTTADAGGEVLVVRAPANGADAGKPVLPGQASDVVRVDLRDMQSGAMATNLQVQNGDTLFVTRAETVYVTGQVKNPGAYPFRKGTTVIQALSLAGGITDRGAKGRIKIIRLVDGPNGEKKEIKVELTDLVQPGDTIMVPEKYF